MSVFGDALAGGLKAIRRIAGQPIVYVAGSLSIPIPLAVQAKNELQSTSDTVVLETVEVRDWSFPAASLVDGSGNVFEPSAGHQILASILGVDHTFEVVLVPGHQVFGYVDNDQSTINVHTQRIG